MKTGILKPAILLACLAAPSVGQAGQFHLGVNLGLGIAFPSLATDTSKPTLGSGELGGQLELQMGVWILGAESDYAMFNQYSTVDPSVGNRRGTYFNPVAPMVGVMLGSVALKVDFRFYGTYALDNVNAALQTISYSSPLGGRVSLTAPVSPNWQIGIAYESVGFSQQSIGGSASPLANKMNLMLIEGLIGFRL